MKKIYSVFPFLISFFVTAAQTTVTLQADRDNTIYSAFTGNSNGVGEYLFIGRNAASNNNSVQRSLLRFNTGVIPAGAVVTSATLIIYVNKTAPAATGIEVHKLLSDWGEGTSDAAANEASGVAATTNDATWNFSFFSTVPWGTAGGDFSGSVSATVPTIAPGIAASIPVSFTGAALTADVQSWVNNGATNFGWALISNNEALSASVKRIISRNSLVTAERPVLTVTYTAGTVPIVLKNFSGTMVNNTARLQWVTSAEYGSQYFEIEHSTDGVNFSPIGRINGRGNSTNDQSYSFAHANVTDNKHFYRLTQYDLDGKKQYSQIILLSVKAGAFRLTPNPATSFISVTTSRLVNGLPYFIHSASGQIVKKGIMQSQKIDIRELTAGMYWLNVQTDTGEKSKMAFIKK